MKRTLLFGAITSIFAINVAMADTVVTSKTYVDGRDALKVDIAQGVGTNNANVGKTLVVNSSGNLELGTPAAGNYVEDSITDGVTTKAPSEDAVHDALENKQDKITTAEVGMNGFDLPALVSYDTTNGLVGNRIGILDQGTIAGDEGSLENYDVYGVEMDNYVPTVRAVAQSVSRMNPGVDNDFNTPISNYSTAFDDTPGNWPNSAIDKLPYGGLFAEGLALKQNRQIGASPVGNANSTDAGKILVVGNDGKIAMSTATNPNNFQTKIPARATKIESTDSTYASSVVTNGTTDGDVGQMAILTRRRVSVEDGADGGEFADYTNADNLIPTAAAVGAELNYKQAKKVCAGWPDGAEHTDANCWLWNMPD